MHFLGKSWWNVTLFLSLIVAIVPSPSKSQLFYTATTPALWDAMRSEENVVEVTHKDDAYWAFIPKNDKLIKFTAFIYHPGCFYDERAYAPIMRKLAEKGYYAFILDVPLSFSVLTPFRADLVLRDFPEIDAWVVGGHGVGGMVASIYAGRRRNREPIEGLALFSSYPCPVLNDLSDTDIKAISLWGNQDGVTSRDQWEDGMKRLPDDAKFLEIDGGNYSFMAFLRDGTQSGDNEATISQEEQQNIVQSELEALMLEVDLSIGGKGV